MKQLENMMNKDPSLRRNTPAACLEKVKQGSTVYSSVSNIYSKAVIKTRVCLQHQFYL